MKLQGRKVNASTFSHFETSAGISIKCSPVMLYGYDISAHIFLSQSAHLKMMWSASFPSSMGKLPILHNQLPLSRLEPLARDKHTTSGTLLK